MGLKDTWIDKVNGESYVLADDINAIAHQAIMNEKNIEEKPNKSDLEKVEAESGNVLLGEETGEIISLDDVSPKEHLVKVGLMSKNLINIDAGLNSAFTKDGDVYTLTKNGSNRFSAMIPLTIPANQHFSVSVECVEYTGTGAYWFMMQLFDDAGTALSSVGFRPGTTASVEVRTKSIAYARLFAVLEDADGSVIRFKNLQIEIGSTATAYTPYVPDTQTVTVKSCGKNIIDLDIGLNSCFTKDGDVYTLTKNGSNRFSERIPCFIPANQKFCFSADFVEYTGNYRFWIQAQIININGSYDPNGLNFVMGSTVYSGSRSGGLAYVLLYLESSDPDGSVIRFKNLQIEIGDTETAYEPYKEGQTVNTTLAEGVTLQSISPNMTVSTDTSGVLIDVDYNKDINKVVEKLTNAILALGGNV